MSDQDYRWPPGGMSASRPGFAGPGLPRPSNGNGNLCGLLQAPRLQQHPPYPFTSVRSTRQHRCTGPTSSGQFITSGGSMQEEDDLSTHGAPMQTVPLMHFPDDHGVPTRADTQRTAERSTDHQSLQHATTGKRNAQSVKAPAQPQNNLRVSKATSRRWRSLAATQALHFHAAAIIAAPSNLLTSRPTMAINGKPSRASRLPISGNTSRSPIERPHHNVKPPFPPWRIYTDPMRQTHWRGVPDFRPNRAVRFKADTSCEIGNVISSLTLTELPFGGVTEVAHQYRERT